MREGVAAKDCDKERCRVLEESAEQKFGLLEGLFVQEASHENSSRSKPSLKIAKHVRRKTAEYPRKR